MKNLVSKAVLFLSCLLFFSSPNAEGKLVKNIIFMVPDGCSLPVLSLARWHKKSLNKESQGLALDNYLCGLVKTHCSNSPIGDSAPTMSAYMTGILAPVGCISTYPPSFGEDDLVFVEKSRQYQPQITLPEAARIVLGKSLGVVATCEFMHATPAATASHYHHRGAYPVLSRQMARNQIAVLLAGGTSLIHPDDKAYLESTETPVLLDDKSGMLSYTGRKLWALFGRRDQAYDLDRDERKVPSLAEMTQKSIDMLSQDKDGFFLVVEGSKIDWAAHANDPVAMVTEFLAFDAATQVAFDFAKKSGDTLVVVLPDHGNSGISIGNEKTSTGYAQVPLKKLMEPFSKITRTAEGMAEIVKNTSPEELSKIGKAYLGFELTKEEVMGLLAAKDYEKSSLSLKNRQGKFLLSQFIEIYKKYSLIGFTTKGHTGEDVFLAVYDPYSSDSLGLMDATQLNKYIAQKMGLKEELSSLTDAYYAPHKEVFKGWDCTISGKGIEAVLRAKKGEQAWEIPAHVNVIYRLSKEGKRTPVSLPTVVVYEEPMEMFYLPRDILKKS